MDSSSSSSNTSRHHHAELVTSYFSCLKLMESTKAADRKQGVSTLVDLLKQEFKSFQAMEASGKFQEQIKMGLWDKTFDAVMRCFNAELSKKKRVLGLLEETARSLSKLVLDLFEDSEPYFFLRYGKELLRLCLQVFELEESDAAYAACALSFAPILKRALKLPSALEYGSVYSLFHLAMQRLLAEHDEFASSTQQRVNFGEIARLCMQAWDFRLSEEDCKLFLRVCGEYVHSLGSNDAKRAMLAADVDLILALQQFVEHNGMDCLPVLREGAKHIVHSLLIADRSVVRSALVWNTFRVLGQACTEFSAHHGNDTFHKDDLQWLDVNGIQVNLDSFMDVLVAREIFEEQCRNISKRALDETALELPPASHAFATCLADFCHYADLNAREREGQQCREVLIRRALGAGVGGMVEDANASNLRCQNLIVLNSLLVRWGNCDATLPESLLARLQALLRQQQQTSSQAASANAAAKVEAFWVMNCLGNLAQCASSGQGAGGNGGKDDLFWSQAFECLCVDVLAKCTGPSLLLLCVVAAQAAAKMSALVSHQVAARLLEMLWSGSELFFCKLKTKQTLPPPLHLVKLIASLPLHALSLDVQVRQPVLHSQPVSDLDESEQAPIFQSLRQGLITWCFYWATAGCDDVDDALVFADTIKLLVSVQALDHATLVLDVDDKLVHMSRLHPRHVATVLPPPTTPWHHRPEFDWMCQTLLPDAKIEASKLLLVLTRFPNSSSSSLSAMSTECLKALTTKVAETGDFTLLPHLKLALETMPIILEQAAAARTMAFQFVFDQLTKLVSAPGAILLSLDAQQHGTDELASTSTTKPSKRMKPSEEDLEADLMFGSNSSMRSSSTTSQDALVSSSVPRKQEPFLKRSGTLESASGAAATAPRLPLIQPSIARHADVLCLLYAMLCPDTNEAFHFLHDNMMATSLLGANLAMAFGKGLVELCERDPDTLMEFTIDAILKLACECRQDTSMLSFATSTLLHFAQTSPRLLFSFEQVQEWLVGSKLFFTKSYLLRFRANEGTVLTARNALDVIRALCLFAHAPNAPKQLFNLATDVLGRNLNHSQAKVRTLCSRELVRMLDHVEDRACFLESILNSNAKFELDYNLTRTYLVLASMMAAKDADLFPVVLRRFTACLQRNKPARQRRRRLFICLMKCLTQELGYEEFGPRQVLLAHADLLWDDFLGAETEAAQQLEVFPYELFGLESTNELCLVTMDSLLPALLLHQRTDLICDLGVNLPLLRPIVYGALGPRNERNKSALALFASIANEPQNLALDAASSVVAINRALTLYCFQQASEETVSLDEITCFIAGVMGATASADSVFARIHATQVLLHLKYLLSFPRTDARVLECLRAFLLHWESPANLAADPTVCDVCIRLVLSIFAKSQALRAAVRSLVSEASALLSDTQLEVCALVFSSHDGGDVGKREILPSSVEECAKRLVGIFPPASLQRFTPPGDGNVTVAFLLSICPAVSEPECVMLLEYLLTELAFASVGISQRAEEPPMEIIRCLRPSFASSDDDDAAGTQTIGSEECAHILQECLLKLCGAEMSERIRNLAAACLAKFGRLSPSSRAFALSGVGPSPQHLGDDLIQLKVNVLEWLVEMLCHQDAMQSLCASRTLSAIMQTESGQTASTLLPQSGKAFAAINGKHWASCAMSSAEPEPGTILYDLIQAKRNREQWGEDSLARELWSTSSSAARLPRNDWICLMSDLLCRDPSVTCDEVLLLLGPICLLDAKFARMLFPWLVFACVHSADNEQARNELSQRFRDLFECGEAGLQRLLVETLSFLRGRSIAEAQSSSSTSGTTTPMTGALYVTTRSLGRSTTPLPRGSVTGAGRDYREFWLSLDLLQVASVALACEMPTTVIFCVELWREVSDGQASNMRGDDVQMDFTTRPKCDELLLGAYRLLNDRDAILGVRRTVNLRDNVEDRKFDGDWLGALRGYDALRLQTWGGNIDLASGQASTLGKLGLMHTMQAVLLASPGAGSGGMRTSALHLEAMWRAQSMGLSALDFKSEEVLQPSMHSILVDAYAALRNKDQGKLARCSKTGIQLLLNTLDGSESLETLNDCLSRINLCLDLERPNTRFHSECLTREHFAAREGMLRLSNRTSELRAHLVAFAEFLRAGECDDMASSIALDRLRQLGTNPVEGDGVNAIKLHLQDALVCWLRGDDETALRVAKHCHDIIHLDSRGTYASAQLQPALRCLIGFWLAKSSAASSQIVIAEWFDKAVADCNALLLGFPNHAGDTAALLSSIHHLLAKYVDRQFQSLDARAKSPEYASTQAMLRERESQLKALKLEQERLAAAKIKDVDASRKQELKLLSTRLTKECGNDAAEEARFTRTRNEMLLLTVQHLLASLHHSSSSSSSAVFRIVHLWFHHQREINPLMADCLLGDKIASKHFVPLVYQIVGRVDLAAANTSSSNEVERDFLRTIDRLVLKLALEHPFETLPHLFALANSKRLDMKSYHMVGSMAEPSSNSSKARAADLLLTQIAKAEPSNGRLGPICTGLRHVYDAFIALAYHPPENNKKVFKASSCDEFAQAKRLIPWNLLPLPCSKREKSSSPLPLLVGMDDEYRVTENGLSAPKILTLHASDGTKSKLLVKGKDDLRQDFIMELILGFVSGLLQNKSKMRLRTYKVLPLTPAAGIIEWVENATSLGDYLYGGKTREEVAKSAHPRHRPNDLPFAECMMRLKNAEDKLGTYRDIVRHFRPVFRHFFFERYGHDPVEWYERRDAYTRSTAANSMVGMILGIGDRHTQNILIDERTAEVIHIDFGITFEQGKTLRTPETVPFRLTPDVIDGFGAAGVHGVFTRASVETVSVLRENAASILTICEVFVHDPLHKWDVSALKQRRMESRSMVAAAVAEGEGVEEARSAMPASSKRNVEAGRVLDRLRQRLEGHVDDDYGEPLNAAAQVKRMIQQATDENNLCLIFAGWAPFL